MDPYCSLMTTSVGGFSLNTTHHFNIPKNK
jgi:hypothetical protein